MSESVCSNSPLQDPSHLITDRILRALTHHLSLLYRSGPNFFILGSTANVYSVSLSPSAPSCTCPDRVSPCKHILFVFLRVLSLSFDEFPFERPSFNPTELVHVLARQTGQGVWASPRAIARFHQLHDRDDYIDGRVGELDTHRDTVCPVCLEEMREGDGVVRCCTCRNGVHGECFKRWKRSRGRERASCVVCRARWREKKRKVGGAYLNLGGYLGQQDEESGVFMG